MTKGSPIVILGMHRSGTSLLANMLHSIGISMGQEFLDADQFNLRGYFEDKEFLGINKGILENSGGCWYAPPTDEEILKGGKKFQSSISNTIARKRKIAGKNSWGWKDPRTCLTCWNFMSEISDAKFIVIVRRLSDIKRSLNKTHGHLANWDEIVERYYDSINKFGQSYPNKMMNVGFEELVCEKYAKETVSKIIQFVGKPEETVQRALKAIQYR